jgi:hypothetical protein
MLERSIGLPRAPRRRPVSPWTKARLRYLRRRWSQGARVREIAAELGHGITYNAVIAKIHRLGISDLSPYGGAPGRRQAAKTNRSADKPTYGHRVAYWYRKGPLPTWAMNAKSYVDNPLLDAHIPRRQRRSLLELSDRTCNRSAIPGIRVSSSAGHSQSRISPTAPSIACAPLGPRGRRDNADNVALGAAPIRPPCRKANPVNPEQSEREDERAIKTIQYADTKLQERSKGAATGRAPGVADAGASSSRREGLPARRHRPNHHAG